jgi:26S proteasome regulatory subunit N3
MTEDISNEAPAAVEDFTKTPLLNLSELPAGDKAPTPPPLDACANRLDRLLGGGHHTPLMSSASRNTKANAVSAGRFPSKEDLFLVSDPAKIVRRWLGSSSGASGKASILDVCQSAERVLDPSMDLHGRTVLMSLLASETVPDSMEISTSGEEKKQDDVAAVTSSTTTYIQVAHREVEAWLLSIATLRLYQANRHQDALVLAQTAIDVIQSHLDGTSSRGSSINHRKTTVLHSPALFPLLARLYRYRALAADATMETAAMATRIYRADLVRAHRDACLRRDVDTQATTLNLLLRGFLIDRETEQAQKLLTNATFPTAEASNNSLCRYLYYSGHVQALRLEYTQSFSNLSTCLRKAPTNAGVGFRIAAQRLWIVVQLLMGEIPDRSVFYPSSLSSDQDASTHDKGSIMATELKPYLKITQAVRRGDLKVFESTVSQYAEQLRADDTFTLISRLSHSVVKAGLRKLNLSYSRISLQDVAQRLSLPSAANAELVVAKAIRDGVIDATIDHEQQYVTSHDMVDVYATTEPMEAFHRRIAYCLTTHNDAMRGMRYRADAYKRELEALRGKNFGAEDDKTDEEKAQEMEDEFEEEF